MGQVRHPTACRSIGATWVWGYACMHGYRTVSNSTSTYTGLSLWCIFAPTSLHQQYRTTARFKEGECQPPPGLPASALTVNKPRGGLHDVWGSTKHAWVVAKPSPHLALPTHAWYYPIHAWYSPMRNPSPKFEAGSVYQPGTSARPGRS